MANISRITLLVGERGSKKVGQALGNVGSRASFASSGVRLLSAALAGLGTAIGVTKLFKLAEGFTVITNQIRLVTDSSEELVAVQRAVFDVAQETRVPLDATTILFRRLALATGELGIEQGDIIDTTRTINKLIQVSGATAIEAKQGIIQLSQGIASGTLRGDELRAVLEQIPAVGKAIATAMEVSFGDLRELGKKGAITSAMIIKALGKSAESANEKFEKITPTVGQAFQVFENALQQAIGTISGGAHPALGELAKKLIELSDNLDVLITNRLADFIDALAEVIDTSAKTIETLEALGVTTINLRNLFNNLRFSGIGFIKSLGLGFQVLQTGILGLGAGLDFIQNKFGAATDEELKQSIDNAIRAQDALLVSSLDTRTAMEALATTIEKDYLESLSDPDQNKMSRRIAGFGETARDAAEEVRKLRDRIIAANEAGDQLPRGGTDIDIPVKPPTEAELRKLENARKKLDRDFDKFLDRLFEPAPLLELADSLENAVEDAITKGVSGGFRALLDGEVLDFAEVFSSIIKDAMAAQLSDSLRDALLGVEGDKDTGEGTQQGLIRSIFGAVTPKRDDPIGGNVFPADFIGPLQEGQVRKTTGSGIGGFLKDNAAGIGSLVMAGGLIAQGFAQTSSAVSSAVESSVTGVEKTRGVIVGPQDIPIFKVGDAIADAFIPLTSLAQSRNTTLSAILAALRSAGTTQDVDTLDALLAGEGNTSTSLT